MGDRGCKKADAAVDHGLACVALPDWHDIALNDRRVILAFDSDVACKYKAAIAQIPEQAWIPIEYPDAVFDEPSGRWISRAEVAEIPFTAFATPKPAEQVPGRLVVRRIPELNPRGQDGLFDVWRFHAFFTTTHPAAVDAVTADKLHRGHAIIEQVHADLKNSALAHLPSGAFGANSAWLVLAVIAFNLTRATAALTGPRLARATTGTVRRILIGVPARIATSA